MYILHRHLLNDNHYHVNCGNMHLTINCLIVLCIVLLQRCRDVSGAAIALFSARLHDPRQSSHQTTLQALVCQLDAALQSSDTQRHGLIFIYDMTDSLYQNFDYQLSQKILTLLKVGSVVIAVRRILEVLRQ